MRESNAIIKYEGRMCKVRNEEAKEFEVMVVAVSIKN